MASLNRGEKFPEGMRVLAVDDDPVSLKLLDGCMKNCKYKVTTATEAMSALKLLRENKDGYDMVITDVNMPGMDGFKLLEQVGLEMDLPVISHGDFDLVMKGIQHGACDYLVKPVRQNEINNIWQHVARREFEMRRKNQALICSQARVSEVGGDGTVSGGSSDQNSKVDRKRKEKSKDNDEGAEAVEDSEYENDDPSSRKKRRVVWSQELHGKFIEAVTQLGLDKAVPKKILDLMNVEGITRENVASHLQKYRLYLKKLKDENENKMAAGYGNTNPSYLHMGQLDRFGEFRTFTGSGQLQTTALASLTQHRMLGGVNSSAVSTLQGTSSSGLLQLGHHRTTLSSSTNQFGRYASNLPSASSCGNQTGGLNRIGDQKPYAVGSSFPASGYSGGSNSVTCASSNPLMLQAYPQSRSVLNQASLAAAPSITNSFAMGVQGSSSILDSSRCSNWNGATQLLNLPSNSLMQVERFTHDQLPTNNLRENIGNGPVYFSSSVAVSTPAQSSRGGLQIGTDMLRDFVADISNLDGQRWRENRQGYNHSLNNPFGDMNYLASTNGMTFDDRTAPGTSSNPQNVLFQSSHDTLNELMNEMLTQEASELEPLDADFEFGAYAPGPSSIWDQSDEKHRETA